MVPETNVPDRHKVLARWVNDYGPNIHIWLAWIHVVVITEVPMCLDSVLCSAPCVALQA